MNEIEVLNKQIEKTKVILSESQKYFEENPNDYSARLLLMSTENYLADLLRQFETLREQN